MLRKSDEEEKLIALGEKHEEAKRFAEASAAYRKAHLARLEREKKNSDEARQQLHDMLSNSPDARNDPRVCLNAGRVFLDSKDFFITLYHEKETRENPIGLGKINTHQILEQTAAKDPYEFARAQLKSEWEEDTDTEKLNLSKDTAKKVNLCQKQFIREMYGLEPDNIKGGVKECKKLEEQDRKAPLSPTLGLDKQAEDFRDYFKTTRTAILDIISDHREENRHKPKDLTPNVKLRVKTALEQGLVCIEHRLDKEYSYVTHISNVLLQLDAVFKELTHAERKHKYFIRSDGKNKMSGTARAHLKILKEIYLEYLENFNRLHSSNWSDMHDDILKAARTSNLLNAQRARFFTTSVSESRRKANLIIDEIEKKAPGATPSVGVGG